MAYDFPSSPEEGQEFKPPGGLVYIYRTPRWVVKGEPLGITDAPYDDKLYGRKNSFWEEVPAGGSGGGGSMTAAEILTALKTVDGAGSGLDADLLDGQSSGAFSLVSHTHAYSSLTSIPSTFAPSAHNHPQSEVTNLVTDLAGKAPTVHTHTTAQVTGLDTALAGKSDTGHTHAYSSLTSIPSTFAPSAHSHPQSEVTSLVTDLGLKAPLASPALTGNPTAPTPTAGDNDTSIATTAFVATAVAAAPGGTFIGDNPPGSPIAGQTWWESDTGNSFIYYNDGSSSQWVQTAVAPANDKVVGGTITIASTAPSAPATNDVWIDTT